jgi:hypothetical protein
VEHLGANLELSSLLLYLVHQGMANLPIIHDTRSGHADRGDAGDMRFYFFCFFRTKPGRRYSIFKSTIEDLIELRNLLRPGGDDQLAANIKRHAVLVAKGTQGLVSGLRQFCFQAARFVVNTGVDNAAIAARLMLSKTNFFFNQQNACKRIATAKGSARRETNDSSTNYREIIHRLPFKSLCMWAGLDF